MRPAWQYGGAEMRAMQPYFRPELDQVRAYQAEDAPASILLDAKENPYAPPALFLKKAQKLLDKSALNRYPDPQSLDLKKAASRHYGIAVDQILVGNGSDELLAILCQACGGHGASCLVPTPTFGMYRLCAKVHGMKVIEEPLGAQGELTQAFLRRARKEKPALIFLAWPNSPTGNLFDPAIIRSLLAMKQTLLVVDEAYAEFCGKSFRSLIAQHGNLAVVSTMSKAWGLAGLRVGFLFAQPQCVSELEKLRLPYNLDRISQSLAALAFSMPAQFARRWKAVIRTREKLSAGLMRMPGVKVYPSQANFVMIRHPQAKAMNQALLGAGIRVRTLFSNPAMQDALQITVGAESEVKALLKVLGLFTRNKGDA
jgi:histidinol-phosphate aminotransferase